MDLNDIDQTQAIFLDEPEEDDGTDELLPEAEKQPKSFLKVLFQKGLTEKSYPLYEGENVIGRNADTCHVCIPSKALSKEHACIEIIKDSHLIYDKGSRNKTKRGKLFLSPNVRYELKSDDEISLADIRCIYIKESTDCTLDGSETDGSESFLLQMDISKDKNTSGLSPVKTSMFDVVNDSKDEDMANKSIADDDSLLQPTQTFAKEKAGNPALCVQETPEREYVEKLSTVVLSESESDEEQKISGRRSSNPLSRSSTGTAVLYGDSDSSIDSEKFCMATQAYFPDTNDVKKSVDASSPSEGNKATSSKQSSDELTQVCPEEEEATQACLADEPTQAFLQKDDRDKKNNGARLSAKGKSTEGTQSFDPKSEDVTVESSDHADTVLKSTQVFEEEEEEEDENEDVAGLFAMSTMAPDEFLDEEDEDATEKCDANDPKPLKQSTKNDATLPVSTNLSEAPTQAPEEMQKIEQKTENNDTKISLKGNTKEDKTQVITDTVTVSEMVDINRSSANISPGTSTSKKSTTEETATLVFGGDENISDTEERGNDSKTTASTLAYGDAETDTQPYGNDTSIKRPKHDRKSPVHIIEDATQAYGNDVETQQYEINDNIKARESHNRKDLVCNADEPTQACEYESDDNDATQAFEQETDGNDATQTISLDEPTQKVASDEPTQKIGFDEPTQTVAIDEPTQNVTFDEPTQEVNFDEPTQKVTFDEPTQKVTLDDPTQKIAMDEPTQKFDFPDEKIALAGALRKKEDSSSEDDSDIEEKSLLKSDDVLDNEATQVFDMKPASPQTANNEIQPTLKYNMEVEEVAISAKENDRKQVEDVQPTLQYDMDIEEKRSKEDISATAEKQNLSKHHAENSYKTASSSSEAENDCYSYPLSPCLEDIGKDDSDSTPHDMDTQPKSPITPLPARSPLKSALVDRKRSPSPSPKRVAFKETAVEITPKDNNVSSRSRRPLRSGTSSEKGKDQDSIEENKERVNDLSPSKTERRKSKTIKIKEREAANETAKNKAKEATEENVATVRRGRRKKGTTDTKDEKEDEEKESAPHPSSDNNVADEIAKDKEENVIEETIGALKKGRRKRVTANTKEDKVESESETLLSSVKITEETAKDEKGVAKESTGTSRRGKRKRGTTNKEEEDNIEIEAETLPSSDQSDTNKDSEKKSKSVSQEPSLAKSAKGKALKGQKPNVSKVDEPSGVRSTKIEGKVPKTLSSNDKQDTEDSEAMKQIADTASETNERVEEDNSTRRSRRRTIKNSMYKDFETDGMKKRESLTKQTRSRDKKGDSNSVQENVDDSDEAKEIKEMEFESDMGDFAAPAVLPTTRKRKLGKQKEDDENLFEIMQEEDDTPTTSKRSTRGKQVKRNNTTAVGVDRGEMPRTTSPSQQGGKPNRTRGRASAWVEKDRPSVSQKDDHNDKNLKDKKEKSETPSQRKEEGKRGTVSKGQVKETPTQVTQKEDKKTAKADTKETVVADSKQSNKRGKNSSKAAGKGNQQLPETSVLRGIPGAAAAVSDEEDTPVNKSSQDSNRGKRKKTSSQEEDEISSTPAKRSKPSAAPVASSPVLRHSTVDSKPKVMFTGVIDEQGEKTVKELGGELVTNIHECSHLVTDKIRRTVKFLGGLAKGVYIVSQQWLDNSKRAGTFLDGQKYLVKDQEMEKQFKFNLANSIASSKKHPLLSGFQIHVSKSVKPDPNQMKDILLCAGAGVLTKMPTKLAEKTVVISCANDEKLCKAAIKAGIPVVTAEFVLTGILQQNINLDAYRLFQ